MPHITEAFWTNFALKLLACPICHAEWFQTENGVTQLIHADNCTLHQEDRSQ